MKLISFATDGQTRFGALLSAERVLDLTNVYPTALAFLEGGEVAMSSVLSAIERAERGEALAGPIRALDSIRLKAPVPQARKLLAVAENYSAHIKEGGRPTFAKEETYPYFFLKPASTALIGSGEPIPYPRIGRKLDYEGELAVVIGRRGRYIAPEQVYRHIAGYAVMNDVSERAFDSKDAPRAERERDRFFDWLVGKWFDGGAPCGPCLVTRDEIEEPHELRLRTRVNGEVRQEALTGEMIFKIPELVSFISRVVTLEPGDLIATGTPSGVGRALGKLLQPGDTVEIEIERIGMLRNAVAAEASA